jgi:hypothetical protein
MELNAKWKNWAIEFISALTIPMDTQTTKVFLMCCLAESQKKELPQELKEEFMYKVIDKHAQFIGLTMTEPVKMMLCVLCNSPGTAVMYVYALRYLQVNAKLAAITTEDLAGVFAYGFPTESELERLWDLQKDSGGGNLLDKINQQITEE